MTPHSRKKHYQKIRVHGKPRQKSRAILEAQGVTLSPNDVVHHIDGNIHNNNPKNLQALSRAEHARLHLAGRPLSEETKQKLSKAKKDFFSDPKNRERMSQIMSGYYAKNPKPTAKITSRPKYKFIHCQKCRRILLCRDYGEMFCSTCRGKRRSVA